MAKQTALLYDVAWTADSTLIQQKTRYLLSFFIPVPLYQGCLITIQFPWPDY